MSLVLRPFSAGKRACGCWENEPVATSGGRTPVRCTGRRSAQVQGWRCGTSSGGWCRDTWSRTPVTATSGALLGKCFRVRQRDRKARPSPDDPQLGQSQPGPDDGPAGGGSGARWPGGTVGVTDVQDRGKHRQTPPPAPPEHHVAVVTAAHQHRWLTAAACTWSR